MAAYEIQLGLLLDKDAHVLMPQLREMDIDTTEMNTQVSSRHGYDIKIASDML